MLPLVQDIHGNAVTLNVLVSLNQLVPWTDKGSCESKIYTISLAQMASDYFFAKSAQNMVLKQLMEMQLRS